MLTYFSTSILTLCPGYDGKLQPVVKLKLGSADVLRILEPPPSIHCSIVHPDPG